MLTKFFLPFLLVSFVLLLAASYLIVQRLVPISSQSATNSGPSTAPESPVRIQVPDVGIDLPVFPAALTGTKWTYTKKGVSHLSSTPNPGATGNPVFYGHNWPNIFSSLHKSILGQSIILTSSTGSEHTYIITDIQVVTPDKTEILSQTGDPRITVFTCTGFLDLKRLVITAKSSKI